jgi:hypothetical protein
MPPVVMEIEPAGMPEPGQLARVQGRHWVVADFSRGSLPVDSPDRVTQKAEGPPWDA